MASTFAHRALFSLLVLGAGTAHGAQSADAATEPGAPAAGQPLWEAGVFGLGGSQQAYPGSRQQVRSGLALPFLVYRGQVVRAEHGNVGVRAARTEDLELDIGFAGSFGSAAKDNDARRGMPAIGWLAEFGPRLKWQLGEAPWGGHLAATLPLRGVFDVSHGLGFRGLAFEPTLAWGQRSAGWGYGASVSLVLGSRRLADTFYGVAPAFVTPDRPAYEARSGLIATRVALNVSRRLSPDWRFFAYARADSVGGAANANSPLVERRVGASAGVGLAWTWMRSDESARP
jgi:outer membrane scaffolding protein for murein synthesis (MipA/OmpV family)